MSFSSGTYTLPAAYNPVVSGNTITSTWANTTLDDIATALSTCVLKDGTQTCTASVAFQVGIAVTTGMTTPSTTFALVNTTATTVNFAGAATTMAIGAAASVTTWTGRSITFTGANTTNNTTLSVINTSNNALACHSIMDISVGGTTSLGDAQLRLTIPSGTSWYVASDNSDSDTFKIGTGTSVGSNIMLAIDTSGNSIIAGTLAVNGASITTDDTTFACFNATATTVNAFGGASTALNIGNASGPITLTGSNGTRIPNGVRIGADSTDNLIDDASTGASTATLYIGNAAITVASDARIKPHIEDTRRNALDIISKLRVVDHDWNDPSDIAPNNRNSRGLWMGLVAQEVVDHVPWAVNAPDRQCPVCRAGEKCEEHKGLWFIEREQLVPLLIKAVQELQEKEQCRICS